jgi:type III secretion system YscD/HrpQ family protein
MMDAAVTQGHVLLKVLSGFHAGAAMELSPGDWILGSGTDNDLVLMDEGIAPGHLLLRVTGEGVCFIAPRNGTVEMSEADETAGGAKKAILPDEGRELPSFAIFRAGGIWLAIGPASVPWPELQSGRPHEIATGGSPLSETGETVLSTAFSNMSLQAHGAAMKAASATRAETPDESVRPLFWMRHIHQRWRREEGTSGRTKKVVALCCVFLLLLGLVLDFRFTPSSQELAAALERELHRRGFTRTAVSPRDEGSPLVSGLTVSNRQLEDLTRYAETLNPRPDLQVASLEDTAAYLEGQARRADAPLRVVRSGDGITLYGYAYDMTAVRELFQDEQQTLHFGDERSVVRSKIHTWAEAGNEVEAVLRAAGFSGRYSLNPDRFHIGLRVRALSAAEIESLHRATREINDYFNAENVLRMEPWPARESSRETVTPAALSSIPAQVAEQRYSPSVGGCGDLSLTGQGTDLAVVFNGAAYRTGAFLPGGLQIRLITPSYIALREGASLTRICNASEMQKE